MLAETVTAIAHECSFELVGIAPVGPLADFGKYETWIEQGNAGEMRYLTDHRAALRRDVRELLPTARSVICLGKLYNTPPPTQGLASLIILALYERLRVAQAEGFEFAHGLVECTKRAFRVRDRIAPNAA